MQKHFYTHIVEIDSVYTILDLLNMNKEERDELIIIIESTIHHVVVDTVLTDLPDEDKKTFLKHLAQDKHDDIWVLLNIRMKNPEKKIFKAVHKVKKEFHADMKKILKK